MFERFTSAAREAVIRAQSEARAAAHHTVGPEDLLVALTHPEAGIAYDVLAGAGIGHASLSAALARRAVAARPLSDEDAAALRTVGIDLDAVIAQVEESFGAGAMDAPLEPARRSRFSRRDGEAFGPGARKTLELALREALRLKHRYIGPEHLLLGLVRGADRSVVELLAEAGVTPADLRDATVAQLARAA